MASISNSGSKLPTEEPPSSMVRQFERHYLLANIDSTVENEELESIKEQLEPIRSKWENSQRRKALVDFVEEKIGLIDDVQIDNALCLGLGSCQHKSSSYAWLDDTNDQGGFVTANLSVFQLLVFETVIDILNKKSDIKTVSFSDPEFTATDIAFLQQRGHKVIKYPASEMAKATWTYGKGFDPGLLQRHSSATFLFAPFLDLSVLVSAICALKPKLFLGTDLCVIVDHAKLFAPDSPLTPLEKDFYAFAVSRDFEVVPCLGNNQGFHWHKDFDDEDAFKRTVDRLVKSQDSQEELRKAYEETKLARESKEEDIPEYMLEVLKEEREAISLEPKFQAIWKEIAEKEKGELEKAGGTRTTD